MAFDQDPSHLYQFCWSLSIALRGDRDDLELFANQLSFFANEILIQQAEREPYRVRMARAFILSRQTEDFSLSDVARAIHVSPFTSPRFSKRRLDSPL